MNGELFETKHGVIVAKINWRFGPLCVYLSIQQSAGTPLLFVPVPLFSDEQIYALAPDSASLKAGKDLARLPKWPTLNHNERVVWGEVQGSGKDPYRSSVDLLDVAFKCSCPSRKFPCKHGIGLLLLYGHEPASFSSAPEPAWVSEWMDKRGSKATKTPVPEVPNPAPDRKTTDNQKRASQRLDSVRAGVVELDRWMEDLVRTGLLSMPEKGAAFWEKMASRMVDAKAPGLATRVKQLGNLPFFDGTAWQGEALRQLGQLHLITSAFNRMGYLSPDLQADVRTQLGLTINQKDLVELPDAENLTDTFLVLSRQTTQEDDLTVQRNYLYGEKSGRFALVLNFAYKKMPIDTSLMPGSRIMATLVFYPGRWPYRAVVKIQKLAHSDGSLPPSETIVQANWQAAQQALADVLNLSPWAEAVPQLAGPLSLATDAGKQYLRDQNGQSQPIDSQWPDDVFYRWLALTGGHPATVFLLRHQTHVQPLGLWVGEEYFSL